MKTIICPECGQSTKGFIKGVCKSCYQRRRYVAAHPGARRNYRRAPVRPLDTKKEEPWFAAWLRQQVQAYLRSNLGPGYTTRDGVTTWPMTEDAAAELCRIVCLARSYHEKRHGGRGPARRRGQGPRLPEDDGDDGAYLDRNISPDMRKLAR